MELTCANDVGARVRQIAPQRRAEVLTRHITWIAAGLWSETPLSRGVAGSWEVIEPPSREGVASACCAPSAARPFVSPSVEWQSSVYSWTALFQALTANTRSTRRSFEVKIDSPACAGKVSGVARGWWYSEIGLWSESCGDVVRKIFSVVHTKERESLDWRGN